MKWSVYPTLICLLSLTLFSAQAQVEGTLHYMNGLPQVVVNNPAFVPKYKFSLGLPFSSLYVGYTNNGFSYNDLVTRKNGATKVDLANWIKVIPDKTYIAPAVSMELFRLGLRLNSKLYMSASATVKSYNHFLLPKGLASIFIEGNAPFVNTTINLSPGLESITYLETAL